MKVGSLFSGFGGLDRGLELAGMQTAWQVEREPFCVETLEKHWPDVPRYGDINEIDLTSLAPVGLVCGGFPCQPFSIAGERQGKEDDRHLWPRMLKVIESVEPRWVLGENVSGITSIDEGMVLKRIFSDLETLSYTPLRGPDGEPLVLQVPACAVNAPHRRDRVFIVAHSDSIRKQQQERHLSESGRRFGDGGEGCMGHSCDKGL